MFIWNNIFFSFAFDSRDHFQELGGKVTCIFLFLNLNIVSVSHRSGHIIKFLLHHISALGDSDNLNNSYDL